MMKKSYLQFALIASLLLLATYTVALLDEPATQAKESFFTQPSEMVERLYHAVDNGELAIFDQPLNREMITPEYVEYRYQLDSNIPGVKVYSRLKTEMPVPSHPNCKATGVSAIISLDARIIKTEVHVTRCD